MITIRHHRNEIEFGGTVVISIFGLLGISVYYGSIKAHYNKRFYIAY